MLGEVTAPPLVVLHGGIGCADDCADLASGLETQFRVIRVDSRGHGRSTLGDAELTYQRLEKDVLAVLRHLEMDCTSIIGFSDGGIVGYRLMVSNEINVKKLVTIGADVELEPDAPVRRILEQVTGKSWREKFPASYETYRRLNPEPDFDRLVKCAVKMWLDSTATGFPDKIENLPGADVLVIRGDRDHLFSRQAAVDLVNRIDHCSFANIPLAGHEAHKEQPAIVERCVLEFLCS
ncbi:alpha/beta fold hydrolase [Allorhodopirellula solitaria]|uniref:alpha/beta fold hydrolase n=1 Tax=Allorhodopirellula solitaria TaxID=2527987 RepID=UPI001648B1C8|nr:alpha/beta hydrolase [Allorhodopirellula solitaria]